MYRVVEAAARSRASASRRPPNSSVSTEGAGDPDKGPSDGWSEMTTSEARRTAHAGTEPRVLEKPKAGAVSSEAVSASKRSVNGTAKAGNRNYAIYQR